MYVYLSLRRWRVRESPVWRHTSSWFLFLYQVVSIFWEISELYGLFENEVDSCCCIKLYLRHVRECILWDMSEHSFRHLRVPSVAVLPAEDSCFKVVLIISTPICNTTPSCNTTSSCNTTLNCIDYLRNIWVQSTCTCTQPQCSCCVAPTLVCACVYVCMHTCMYVCVHVRL